MATGRRDDIHAFRAFMDEQLANGAAALTPAEVLHLWQIQNPREDEEQETIQAIRRGLAEIEAGRERPARGKSTISSAIQLADVAIDWLRENFAQFPFVVERDVVWTLQKHLVRSIGVQSLPFRVFNDYPMFPGRRRSLSTDLAF